MDIYAPNYVPLWLRAVNESYAIPVYTTAFAGIEYHQYIRRFAGSMFVSPVQLSALPSLGRKTPSLSPMSLDNYDAYWLERLQHEFTEQSINLELYSLYNVEVHHAPNQEANKFRLHVPGLRENAPRLDLGDVVNIRPLVVLHNDPSEATLEWYQEGKHCGVFAPGFQGFQYVAVVWGIDRRNEDVILRIDGFTGFQKCNVAFCIQETRCEPLCRAASSTSQALQCNAWLRTMLLPDEHDGIVQSALSPAYFNLTWVDQSLNWEQKKAINAVVCTDYGIIPYLISGPPGTGKTKTLVEIALQLLVDFDKSEDHDRNESALPKNGDQTTATFENTNKSKPHLLICAPSDSAADTLAIRLAEYLGPDKLLRLNSWTRTFAEVPDRLLPYTHTDSNLFSLPSFEILLSYQVVVTSCRDADLLVQARLTNDALAHVVTSLTSLVGSSSTKDPPLHWTALLLDEAGQAIEPEALIPLQVVMPSASSTRHPRLIAAGDEFQLGPKLVSKMSTGLEISLFERLFERPIYKNHPLSRANGARRTITKQMLPMMRPPFANLVRNYRSHPAILAVPSMMFYNDTLIPENDASELITDWPGWTSTSDWPVVFVNTNSSDDIESVTAGAGTGSGALYNDGEAQIALSKVQSLLEHGGSGLKQKEIAIMSPFRAQVNRIRQLFRKNNLYAVNIGPLEAFQGLESRIVIICTTRTRLGDIDLSKYVRNDLDLDLGIIDQPKRFNVAVTRAKEGLIVIGNAGCLTCTGDRCWTKFLRFCERNECFEGLAWKQEGVDLEETVTGSLENAMKYKQMSELRRGLLSEEYLNDSRDMVDNRKGNRLKLRGRQPEMDEVWGMRETALSAVGDFVWEDHRDEDEA